MLRLLGCSALFLIYKMNLSTYFTETRIEPVVAAVITGNPTTHFKNSRPDMIVNDNKSAQYQSSFVRYPV